MDRRYLRCIADNYGGGPVGIDTLAAALSEQRDSLEDVVEPFLIQHGLVLRTPRGRVLGDAALRHLGLALAHRPADQPDLLNGGGAGLAKDSAGEGRA